MTQVQELHAVVIPWDADEPTLRATLRRYPFFFVDGTTTHLKFQNRAIPPEGRNWDAAEVLELNLNVLSKEYLLKALWYVQQMANAPIEHEEASLIQLQLRSCDEVPDQVAHSPAQDAAFHEICVACRDFVAHIDNQCIDEVPCKGYYDGKSSDSCGMAHPEDNSNLRNAKPKSDVVQISLEQTLVGRQRQFDPQGPMFQWFQNPNWALSLAQPWPDELSDVPSGMRIHAATWEELRCQVLHNYDQVEKIELYVDGATAADQAAWAVVVITHCASGAQLQGVLSGLVGTDSDSLEWIGATVATNITAEVTALAVAQLLSISLQAAFPVIIRPDLQLSKYIAEKQALLKTDAVLSATCDFLARFNNGQVRVQEVRAHKERPWNELADCVAKHTARTGVARGKVPWDRIRTAVHDTQEREWAWLQQAPTDLQQVFPPLFDSSVIQICPTKIPTKFSSPSMKKEHTKQR